MKTGRSQIIWISGDGVGAVRRLRFSPALLRILILILLLCVGIVPFLESGLIVMAAKVADLEKQRQSLAAEVQELRFLKAALTRMEKKDAVLRAYFGMEAFESLSLLAFGGGDPGRVLDRNPGARPVTADPIRPGLGQRVRRLADNAEVLDRLIVEQDLARQHTPSILPVSGDDCRITSNFGWRENPFTGRREFHSGIDVKGPGETRIIAPAGGIVLKKGYDNWLGNYVVLQHTPKLKTIYGHMEKALTREDAQIKRGEPIGIMGNTGMSTSRHLHYTVVSGNRAVDPMRYILDVAG